MTQPPPLLDILTAQALDEDYRVVAARGGHGLRRRPASVAVAVVFGILIAVAAVQTARNRDVVSAGRDQLISRITERRSVVLAQQQRIGALQATLGSLQMTEERVTAQLASARLRSFSLERQAAWSTVDGSGLRVVVSDRPGGDTGGLTRDSDLTLLVGGLWRAGATAIAVNGQRLTVLSALRNSGEVIRVNGISLSAPYVVEAVGPAATMRTRFTASTAGAEFVQVASAVGLTVTMQNVNALHLPAAPDGWRRIRFATPIDEAPKSIAQEDE